MAKTKTRLTAEIASAKSKLADAEAQFSTLNVKRDNAKADFALRMEDFDQIERETPGRIRQAKAAVARLEAELADMEAAEKDAEPASDDVDDQATE